MNWKTAVVHTAGQVLWQDIADEEQEKQEEEEDGDEDDDQGGVHLHVHQVHYRSHPSKHWQGLDKYRKSRFDQERVGLGGEGDGLGGKGVGLEEHHWADVGVGLHVHAAVVVVVEEGLWRDCGEKEEEEVCKLDHLAWES